MQGFLLAKKVLDSLGHIQFIFLSVLNMGIL
jgi:hypothetical protein